MNPARHAFWCKVHAAVAALILALAAPPSRAQQNSLPDSAADPLVALSAAISAACRGNAEQFANYLPAESAAAFRALPESQRVGLLHRFSLTDDPGKPLASTDLKHHEVLRCDSGGVTVEFHFGDPRVHENLAFIPVSVVNSEQTEFGLVREGGVWRLLSLGILLLDIPQLSRQWAEQDVLAREDAAISALRDLSDAIRRYQRAFGKLPESLSVLGPAPKDQISPEQASLVSAALAAGSEGGYQFRYRIVPDANGNDNDFELAASPVEYGKAGRRSFFLDSQGKVHGADKHGAVALPEDPLLAGEKTP